MNLNQRLRRFGLQRAVVAATLLSALALQWLGREDEAPLAAPGGAKGVHEAAAPAQHEATLREAGGHEPLLRGVPEAGSAVCEVLDHLLSDDPLRVPPLAGLPRLGDEPVGVASAPHGGPAPRAKPARATRAA